MVSINRGFALLVVLWVVAILSAISLAMISSAQVEARTSSADWDRLVGERMAHSGQEFALFLRSRGIGLPNENLDGLPVEILTANFRYSLHFPEGAVDLILESDIGKINPTTADPQFLQNFAALWTGDAAAAQQLTAALQDWSDPDSEVRDNGAEIGFYSSLGYAPRNSLLGIADLPLIRGFGNEDFYPKIETHSSSINVRESLEDFVTTISSGGQINPNFAPMMVLRAVPDLTADQAARIGAARREGVFFRNLDQFRSIAAIAPDSQALRFFRFDQWTVPAWLTILRDGAGGTTHSERRVYETRLKFNFSNGSYESPFRLHRIELDHLPEFVRK